MLLHVTLKKELSKADFLSPDILKTTVLSFTQNPVDEQCRKSSSYQGMLGTFTL